MAWKTLHELVSELGLRSDPTDRSALLAEVTQWLRVNKDSDPNADRWVAARKFLQEDPSDIEVLSTAIERRLSGIESAQRAAPYVADSSALPRARRGIERRRHRLSAAFLLTIAGAVYATTNGDVPVFDVIAVISPNGEWRPLRVNLTLGVLLVLLVLYVLALREERALDRFASYLVGRDCPRSAALRLLCAGRHEFTRDEWVSTVVDGAPDEEEAFGCLPPLPWRIRRLLFLGDLPREAMADDTSDAALSRLQEQGWIVVLPESLGERFAFTPAARTQEGREAEATEPP